MVSIIYVYYRNHAGKHHYTVSERCGIMAKVSTSVSIDADVKAKAQELFADLGLDLSTAVNLFLKQAVRENAIPFSICREVPNMDTIAAMREAEEISRHPECYKRYSSFADVLQEVNNDA